MNNTRQFLNRCDCHSNHLYEYCRPRYHDGIVHENRYPNYHVPKLDDDFKYNKLWRLWSTGRKYH